MHAVVWLLWGGTCQHQVALNLALPHLEGHPQHGRECVSTVSPLVPTFLSCLPSLLFTSGVLLWRWGPAGPAVTALRFQWWHWEQSLCLQNISLQTGCSSSIGLPWLYLTETENSRKHLWDLIVPTSSHSSSETGGWRAAPVAQLKPETNVGCCVMTKSHMLIAPIR